MHISPSLFLPFNILFHSSNTFEYFVGIFVIVVVVANSFDSEEPVEWKDENPFAFKSWRSAHLAGSFERMLKPNSVKFSKDQINLDVYLGF